MKHFSILVFVFLLFSNILYSQGKDNYSTIKIKRTIYSIDFNSSKSNLLDYLKRNQVKIITKSDDKKYLELKLEINPIILDGFDTLLNGLGYSTENDISSVSNLKNIEDIKLEISFLKEKRDSYALILKEDIDKKSDIYLKLWNEQKQIEERIFIKERELLKLTNEDIVIIEIKLSDESNSPEYTDVSFVNMPGLEYSFLSIENPTFGISAKNYQGYFLKYLFTKGKSFATIGVYKNKDIISTDTKALNEMFLIGFGQDFYSRHLGRGSRKFLNLYSGYVVGGLFGTSKENKENMFYIAPTIGLELFKNKFMLIDTKVSYFLPLNSMNVSLRGVSYNLSLNFVF